MPANQIEEKENLTFKERLDKALVEGRILAAINKKKKSINKIIWMPVTNLRKKLDLRIGEKNRKKLAESTKIVPNRIIFTTFNNVYNCNPKYILEELVSRDLPVEIYWAVSKKQLENSADSYPKEAKLVIRNSLEYFKILASSKVWIDNALNCVWRYIPKKEGQVYLQTWHGSMGLKRVSREDISDKYWLRIADICGEIVDACFSNSAFETEVFRTTYFEKANILEYGHARNDILFAGGEKRKAIKEKVCKYFDFAGYDEDGKLVTDLDKIKLCLYAPTFRDDGSFDCYDIDFEELTKALTKRFGGKWKILNRFHFHNKGGASKTIDDSNVVNATAYPDIQELMVASDIGITDYSSWICDFLLTGRPGFIYATDIAKYNNERGFYYPLEETPFPIATNNKELEEKVLSFDQDEYDKDMAKFLEARGCKEDGHAAERIVDLIVQKMELKK